MLTDTIFPGDKFDIEKINLGGNEKKVTYSSMICDIIDESRIVAILPTVKGVVLPLPVGEKYELFIYSKTNLYRCRAVLKKRFRESNMHLMVLELYEGLQRYQRREFYRLTCNTELKYYVLSEEEAENIDDIDNLIELENSHAGECSIKGLSVDISGGGMRFVSSKSALKDSYLLLDFVLPIKGVNRSYLLLAKVISSRELPNKRNMYEYRVQFERISIPERELLIKYIFEEERRYRKNEKG